MKPSSSPLESVLAILKNNPKIARNITSWKVLPARPADYRPFPENLRPEIKDALRKRGIEQLYSHQAEAIEHIIARRNAVIVTPTASGKSLCYNLPVLQSVLENEQSRALYLFPTKALSQDQYNELYDFIGETGRPVKVYTFDGDTPASARRAIRSAGQIVVTNPDMLHTGILPHHTLWIKLFENLRYIVIDEIHHYRGVFGSHLANVIRRLKRVAQFYNSHPTFICCSATIANPLELTERLTEEKFALVDKSGAPQGEKVFVFYNPPIINAELGIRKSVINESRRIATRFLSENLQTIVFARSRLRVEILTTYLKRAMRHIGKNPERVKGYRGGYLPLERRAIEQGVKSGEILGVVSTNALELGIDIGTLKVAILAGYPGSVSRTWQQGGRAGRKTEASAVILVASSSPLDQYLINHPDYFFGSPPEAGLINPDNIAILASHLKCGAFELPFDDGEKFGPNPPVALMQALEKEQILHHSGTRWHYATDAYPAEEISLRSASVDNFVVLNVRDKNSVIAEVDYDSAPFLIHPEAIYIHQSQTFYIDELDWERRTAYARPIETEYYTDAQSKTDIRVLHCDISRESESVPSADVAPPVPDSSSNRSYPILSKNFGNVSVVT
ncbi:MAG: DEAD/DEAH box helicase, partial [bacterium]